MEVTHGVGLSDSLTPLLDKLCKSIPESLTVDYMKSIAELHRRRID